MRMHILSVRERLILTLKDLQLFWMKIKTAYWEIKTIRASRRLRELQTIELIQEVEGNR